MELFLDDPNTDVETQDRNSVLIAYYLSLFLTAVPLANVLFPFLYLYRVRKKNTFIAGHFTNLISLQILILIFTLVAIVLFFILELFYVLLFVLFIILFQSVYIYYGIAAAKNGTVNSFKV